MKKLLLTALIVPVIAFAQTYPSPTFNSVTLQNPLTAANGGTGATSATGTGSVVLSAAPTVSNPIVTGSFSATGLVTLADHATQAANTIIANATGSTASPTALSVPSCSTSSSALNWTSGTGLICNTSINAATLGGATFAAPGPIGSTPSAAAFTTLSSTGAPTVGTATIYPTVPTNTALAALSTAVVSTVTRLGFTAVGDAPPLTYTASASACSLNSGAGDNGSQVQSSNSKCWLANFPAGGADIREFGAKVDGVTDDTTAVQNDIAYESTTGGVVLFPAGTTLLNAGVTVAIGGVTIKGIGWQEYSGTETSGTPGPNSSWILSTNVANSPVTFANTVENARLLDIAFRQTQPADAPGWTPTVYPPTIQIQGGSFSSGAVDIENVFCWKCYSFISMGSTGNFVGRITLKHLWGQPLSAGVTIIAASDTVLVEDVHFWPFATANLNIANWVQANGTAFNIYRADNPIISNIFVFGMNAGFIFSSSTDGSSQHFQLSNIGLDSILQGIYFQEGAHGANGQISNFYVQAPSGAPNTSNGLTVVSGTTGLGVDITNFRSTGAGASCMNVGGTADIASVNTWCDNWNASNTSIAGIIAGTGNTITLGGRLRSNGGNGAALTGGSGWINQAHVN